MPRFLPSANLLAKYLSAIILSPSPVTTIINEYAAIAGT